MHILKMGQIDEAIEMSEHVVAMAKTTLEEKDHRRLTSEHSLATAYLKSGRIKDTIRILENMKAVLAEAFDTDDRLSIRTNSKLAGAYRML